MKARRFASYLLGFALSAVVTHWVWLILHPTPQFPSRRMSDVMISRAGIEDVKAFYDQSYIHGLKFFYFKTKDYERFVAWLGLHQRDEIPVIFKDDFQNLKSQVDWRFDWSQGKIYSIYYCNGVGIDWTVDLILAIGNDVIYMTSGYMSAEAVRVDDYEACSPKDPYNNFTGTAM